MCAVQLMSVRPNPREAHLHDLEKLVKRNSERIGLYSPGSERVAKVEHDIGKIRELIGSKFNGDPVFEGVVQQHESCIEKAYARYLAAVRSHSSASKDLLRQVNAIRAAGVGKAGPAEYGSLRRLHGKYLFEVNTPLIGSICEIDEVAKRLHSFKQSLKEAKKQKR